MCLTGTTAKKFATGVGRMVNLSRPAVHAHSFGRLVGLLQPAEIQNSQIHFARKVRIDYTLLRKGFLTGVGCVNIRVRNQQTLVSIYCYESALDCILHAQK